MEIQRQLRILVEKIRKGEGDENETRQCLDDSKEDNKQLRGQDTSILFPKNVSIDDFIN